MLHPEIFLRILEYNKSLQNSSSNLFCIFFRYMMLIQGDGQVYFADRDNSIFEVTGLRFPHVRDTKRVLQDTLLDGVSFTFHVFKALTELNCLQID